MQHQVWQNTLGGLSATALASSALARDGDHHSSAQTIVAADLGNLTIKLGAFTGTSYARVSAQSYALQSYSWDGSGSASRTLSGSLDFDIVSVVPFSSTSVSASAEVEGAVTVFSLASNSFNFDVSQARLGNFEAFAQNRADYRSEAQSSVHSVDGSPYQFNVSFSMEAGRTYFLQSWLGAYARFGGALDATHTFIVHLDDVQGLSASEALADPQVITSVPEPEGIWLWSAGLAMLGLLRRRYRSV
ncbi:hypothetical protein GTP23_12985 [Pseudoduganella sp. FT93W]|uniref:Uncharacterized protein n=1 Tax=Duganella fentianensis TaxID=2692177 RepID=A0A845HY65_9BURK|nr:hypothetical protein [Duganella fentianensis]MYN45963.1 hypothetical protein [Duganella fentianensis]